MNAGNFPCSWLITLFRGSDCSDPGGLLRELQPRQTPDGKAIAPVFGNLFLNEPIPTGGSLDVSDLTGFGLILNPAAKLISSKLFLVPNPENGLSMADDEKLARKVAINGAH